MRPNGLAFGFTSLLAYAAYSGTFKYFKLKGASWSVAFNSNKSFGRSPFINGIKIHRNALLGNA